ncbi:MAG: hypothetical protein JSV73_09460 [Flavobacteriaceae bacterium]|nr:MAG: hypothetical protein JSV73_09460 [Flavobacteriaceae bacterium]
MKLFRTLLITMTILLVTTSAVVANDFDWTRNLSIQAQADPAGFRARLETRFKIGDVHVDAVLSNVENPADAYVLLRLGEMSGRSVDNVIEKYRHSKGKGWGALAKSLGIKPGSKEFHALKSGHDLKGNNSRVEVSFSSYDRRNDNYVDNGHGKGKGKGKR